MDEAELIYLSMIGDLITPWEGIEDEYAQGSQCDLLYQQSCAARDRLCQKLNTEEDMDLELIFDCFSAITKHLCCKMYSSARQGIPKE